MSQGVAVQHMAGKAAAVSGSSVVDSNRFYSILLDARAVSVAEGMHDVSEKLLKGEKDNAKSALDQLWALKKSLTGDESGAALETLIAFYQDKMNVLRENEEAVKKVSQATRVLIEEKRRKDEELATVKSQIGGCTHEIKKLNTALESLQKQEDELSTAARKLKEEISANESKIVGGLYDIIMHNQEKGEQKEDGTEALEAESVKQASDAESPKKSAPEPLVLNRDDAIVPVVDAAPVAATPAPEVPAAPAAPPPAPRPASTSQPYYEDEPSTIYPKSVVRMGGKIIGEYYHDANVMEKDMRHYIYNSLFISERLTFGLRSQNAKSNPDAQSELIKIAEDAANRVRDNEKFHFEVSTNEIINDSNLRQLCADLRGDAWDEVDEFEVKLSAKVEALGQNYEAMLQEQMGRYSESE